MPPAAITRNAHHLEYLRKQWEEPDMPTYVSPGLDALGHNQIALGPRGGNGLIG